MFQLAKLVQPAKPAKKYYLFYRSKGWQTVDRHLADSYSGRTKSRQITENNSKIFDLQAEDLINSGAETLKQLANQIDTTKMPSPFFLMVLVGVGQYAYRREDGVFVVPIGCLKP